MNEAVDEAVAEVVEEEVDEVVESVDTDEESEETETEAAEGEEAASKKDEPLDSSPKKDDDGFDKRAAELTSKFYTEKQQKEYYKQQFEDLQAQQKPDIPQEPGKTLADFEYDEGKFSEYVQGQAVAGAKAEIERSNQQQAGIQRRAEFEAKEQGFASKVDDYHTVTRNQSLQITQSMVDTLATAEKGPDVLYYLGKNPNVAASLSAMSPLDAARELGRIEATKLVKPEPSTKPKPSLVPKIKGSDSSATRVRSDSPESDKLSDEEWLKRERKRLATKDK